MSILDSDWKALPAHPDTPVAVPEEAERPTGVMAGIFGRRR